MMPPQVTIRRQRRPMASPQAPQWGELKPMVKPQANSPAPPQPPPPIPGGISSSASQLRAASDANWQVGRAAQRRIVGPRRRPPLRPAVGLALRLGRPLPRVGPGHCEHDRTNPYQPRSATTDWRHPLYARQPWLLEHEVSKTLKGMNFFVFWQHHPCDGKPGDNLCCSATTGPNRC